MMITRPRLSSTPTQDGYVLLEVLISILLFSLGVLGLISVQSNAIQASRQAQFRATATFAANDMLARMWVDRGNLASYAGTSTLTSLPGGTIKVTENGAAITVVVNWQPPGATSASAYTIADTLVGN